MAESFDTTYLQAKRDAHQKEIGSNPLDANNLKGIVFGELSERFSFESVSSDEKKKEFMLFFTLYTRQIVTLKNPSDLQQCRVPEVGDKSIADQYATYCKQTGAHILSGVDFARVSEYSIDKNGIFHFYSESGKEIYSRDVIKSWNQNLPKKTSLSGVVKPVESTGKKQRETTEKTRIATEKLREDTGKETFLGGNLIFEYKAPAVIGAYVGSVVLHSFIYRDFRGDLQVVKLKNPIIGTKDWMKKNFLRIMEQFDLSYEPESRSFQNKPVVSFLEAKQKLAHMSLEEYRRLSKNPKATAEDLAHIKSKMNLFDAEALRKSIQSEMGNTKTFMQKLEGFLVKNGLQLVFWPIFFESYRHNQNAATLLHGVGSWGLMETGVRLGARVPGGAVTKFVSGAVLGVGAMVVGEKSLEKLGGRKEFWRHFYGKESGVYIDGKSAIGQAIGSLGLIEAWDLFNRHLRSGGDQKPMDIVMLPRIDMAEMPKSTLIRSSISLGIKPRDWIHESGVRDIDDWNKQVDAYKSTFLQNTWELIDLYQRGKPPFSANISKRNLSIFETKFHELIIGGGDDFPETQKKITAVVVAELSNWSPRSKEIIGDTTRVYLEDLRINDSYIQKRESELAIKKLGIDSLVNELGKIMNGDKKQYVSSLLDRMITNKDLCSQGKWIETEILGTKSQKWISSEENNWFQGLLSDNRIIEVDVGDGINPISIGDYFALLLDQMLEYKRESEFIREIKSGNKKGIQWGV